MDKLTPNFKFAFSFLSIFFSIFIVKGTGFLILIGMVLEKIFIAIMVVLIIFLMPFIYYQFESDINTTNLTEEGKEAYDTSTSFWYGFFNSLANPIVLAVIALAFIFTIAYVLPRK